MNGVELRDALAAACESADIFYTLKNNPSRITIDCDDFRQRVTVRIEFEDDGSLEGVYVCAS